MAADLIAWVFNLDAELELERGPGTPNARVREAIERALPSARAALMMPGDVDIDLDVIPPGSIGRCWCPTPSALGRLRAAGVEPERAPPLGVLRAVNSRAFCAGLGVSLPGGHFATQPFEVQPGSGAWRLKRAFGFAGRGQRVVRQPLSDLDRLWIRASFPSGLQVEPDVEVLREVSTHGVVDGDGAVKLAPSVEQRCERGAWVGSAPLSAPVPDAVTLEASRVGEALAAASYFGPFGVDAFEYRHAEARRWNLRSEVNARYTMGFVRPENPLT